MATTEPPKVEPPKGEHIFPNTELTELVLRWKALTASANTLKGEAAALTEEAARAQAEGRSMEVTEANDEASSKLAEAQDKHAEAFDILEVVITKSVPMFERLAQYEGFHHTVELPQLVQAARYKVAHWLAHCGTEELHAGKLFSWMSTCAKNAFRSEVAKQRQFTTRYHTTGESLEKFVGSEDHAVDRHDAAAEAQRRIQTICTRWGDPQELGAVRYCVDCISDLDRQPPNRQTITNGARYAYGLSEEKAKFFYQWALYSIRDVLLERSRAPFTEQDVLRHRESYTFWPDIIDEIGWQNVVKLVMKLGGQRLKIPTAAQLKRHHDDYLLQQQLHQTSGTPEEFETVGRQRGRSGRQASDLFAEMSENLSNNRSGEHPLYSDDEHGHST